MNETDFKNIIYKGIIGELERREARELHKGNAHHLAQHLTDLVYAEYQQSADAIKEEIAYNDRKGAIDGLKELQGDIGEIKTLMECINHHIHWLAGDMPEHQITIPEFKAVGVTLNRMMKTTETVKRGL